MQRMRFLTTNIYSRIITFSDYSSFAVNLLFKYVRKTYKHATLYKMLRMNAGYLDYRQYIICMRDLQNNGSTCAQYTQYGAVH